MMDDGSEAGTYLMALMAFGTRMWPPEGAMVALSRVVDGAKVEWRMPPQLT